jgi:hypothetical protein
MITGNHPAKAALLALLGGLAAGCGEREDVWDTSASGARILALKSAAVVVDGEAERVLVLQAEADLSLAASSVPVGKNIPPQGAAATPDQERLAVLCRGDVPRRTAKDQGPALFLLGGAPPALQARYELSDPLSTLTMDPASRYAVVSASSDDSSFVSNPNELIIADLSRPPGAGNPVALTLRSFGGRPQRLDFTPPLELPSGTRRLLVAQTDRDVALLDLEDPSRSEITVRLTSGTTRLEPAGLAVSDGDPGNNSDARLAIRLARDPDVVIVDLLSPTGEAAASGAPFRPVPNIVGVGGVATDLAFVRTDGGLRLAAVVPSTQSIVLVEPATGTTASLPLSTAFNRITLVTAEAQTADETALLWSTSQNAIGFLSLGKTSGKPYKSVEELPLQEAIRAVLPVPAPFAHRKILVSASGSSFYVLDLLTRSLAPLASKGAQLSVAPDGRRAWAFNTGRKDLAAIDLESAHPQNLLLPYNVLGVADIERRDGGRALLAFHRVGGLSATLFDAAAPSLLTSREAAALSVEALP